MFYFQKLKTFLTYLIFVKVGTTAYYCHFESLQLILRLSSVDQSILLAYKSSLNHD